jgi:mycoredoxin
MTSPRRLRRWGAPAVLVLAAAVVATQLVRDGQPVSATVAGAALLAAAWFGSPLRGRRDPTHAEALQRAARGEVVVYWRPGCPYCARLLAGLRGRRGWLRVNIWQDPDAAAFVRAHNDGDEVVPTVLVGDETWTNPEPARVRAVLGAV